MYVIVPFGGGRFCVKLRQFTKIWL